MARELGLEPRTNVLVMHRTSYTVAGVACEHMRIHIVPERYTFRLSVPGPLEIARALHPTAPGASYLCPGLQAFYSQVVSDRQELRRRLPSAAP